MSKKALTSFDFWFIFNIIFSFWAKTKELSMGFMCVCILCLLFMIIEKINEKASVNNN